MNNELRLTAITAFSFECVGGWRVLADPKKKVPQLHAHLWCFIVLSQQQLVTKYPRNLRVKCSHYTTLYRSNYYYIFFISSYSSIFFGMRQREYSSSTGARSLGVMGGSPARLQGPPARSSVAHQNYRRNNPSIFTQYFIVTSSRNSKHTKNTSQFLSGQSFEWIDTKPNPNEGLGANPA